MQLLIRDVYRISVKSNCIHLPQHDPGVGTVSNRNKDQGYFLRYKCYPCVGLSTLPSSFTVSRNSGSFNILESERSVEASNGFSSRRNPAGTTAILTEDFRGSSQATEADIRADL
jgi:hypothetical protein